MGGGGDFRGSRGVGVELQPDKIFGFGFYIFPQKSAASDQHIVAKKVQNSLVWA